MRCWIRPKEMACLQAEHCCSSMRFTVSAGWPRSCSIRPWRIRRLDLTVGKGSTARTRALELPPFTLVGATTRAGALSSPLRDRFGLIQRLEFYGLNDLQAIVERAAGLLDLELTADACAEIALRCRGTPRIANRLLRRVRDVACVRDCSGPINQPLVCLLYTSPSPRD